jgi:hypothetical protein
LTAEQYKAFGKLFEVLEVSADEEATPRTSEAAIDRAIVNFLVTLLDHNLAGKSYDSILLSTLATIGLRLDGG